MDNKITLSVLAQMLSTRSGRSRKECEEMLRSFFQHISASLSAGESVKVKGFGTFKISPVEARMSVDISSGQGFEIPAHNRIVFLPARELATAVNAPFEMFETIELSDEVTEKELQDEKNSVDNEVAEEATVESGSEAADEETLNSVEETREAIVDTAETVDVAKEPVDDAVEPVEGVEQGEQTEDQPVDPDATEEYRKREHGSGKHFRWGFFWGMVAAILLIVGGAVALYFLNEDFSRNVDTLTGRRPKNVATASKDMPAADSQLPKDAGMVADVANIVEEEDGMAMMVEDGNVVPTRPSDENVYDTITSTSALGVMARKHYGNYHFWPYIYKENEKILGHPDRIRPGTRVVIPPLSKYGVDPKNPEDIARAKRLDAEIYSRYKKK